MLSPTVALVIAATTDAFDVRRADVLRAEFAVMVELGFELNVPPPTVLLQFSRLMQVLAVRTGGFKIQISFWCFSMDILYIFALCQYLFDHWYAYV